MPKFRQALLFYLLPGLLLVFFVLVMNSAGFFQGRLQGEDRFSFYAAQVKAAVEQGNWQGAKSSFQALRQTWEQVQGKVQIAAEKDKLEELEENLARLSVLLEIKETVSALSELAATVYHWESISR